MMFGWRVIGVFVIFVCDLEDSNARENCVRRKKSQKIGQRGRLDQGLSEKLIYFKIH